MYFLLFFTHNILFDIYAWQNKEEKGRYHYYHNANGHCECFSSFLRMPWHFFHELRVYERQAGFGLTSLTPDFLTTSKREL